MYKKQEFDAERRSVAELSNVCPERRGNGPEKALLLLTLWGVLDQLLF